MLVQPSFSLPGMPLAGVQAPDEAAPAPDEAHDKLCHVLLVEDDECTLRVVAAMLQNCDYQVTLARNGREALDVLEAQGDSIDLILTDLLMPEVNGMDLICEVVQGDSVHGVPIIVMSSESRDEVISEAFKAGAKDFLVKPIRRRELSKLWHHVPTTLERSSSAHLPGQEQGAKQRASLDPACPAEPELAAAVVATAPATHPSSSSDTSFISAQTALPQSCTRGTGSHSRRAEGPQSAPGSGRPSIESPVRPPSLDQPLLPPHTVQQSQQQQPARPALRVAVWGEGDEAAAPGSPPQPASAAAQPSVGLPPSCFAFGVELSQRLRSSLGFSPEDVKLDIAPLTVPAPPAASSKPLAAVNAAKALSSLKALNLERSNILGPVPDLAHISQDAPLIRLPGSMQGSAFSSFTAVVPRPCERGSSPVPRGMDGMEMVGPQSVVVLGEEEQPCSIMQEQRFFTAFQAAVERQTGVVLPHSGTEAVGAGRDFWAANRRLAIAKFREKRKARSFDKKVRYESRRRLAETRPRVRGQFVRAAMPGEAQQEVPLAA